jgi:hypothetical protein
VARGKRSSRPLLRAVAAQRLTLCVLSWREVDFAGVVVAGLIAGYVMAIAGLWAGRVPGLAAIDIADFGRRYIVSDRPSAWYFGLVSHLANSVILAFLWASAVEPNLAWPRWLEGAAFGVVLAVTLAGAVVAPLSGLGFMGGKGGGASYASTTLLLHVLWGVLVGLVYVPP